jgi:hypothetical protein
VAGRDITEGDGNVWALAGDGLPIARGIADIGIVSTDAVWQNTNISYDTAIGGMPFISAISDKDESTRQTAPFRKDQFDNGNEPGEQSLTGWWLRSQMSFHSGAGINFYDPGTNDESGHYRFADSKGVDVWTKGQVTMLKDVTTGHITTGDIRTTGRRFQEMRSIEWNGSKGVLLKDEYDVDKIDATGAETHFINYNAGTDAPVHGICDDGTTAYWITNTATKKTVYKKPLTGSAADASDIVTMFDESGLISNAIMEFVKERIVMCADNKVYEFSGSHSGPIPTPIYTHPSTSHIYTSITASGPAIYIAGYNGIQSTIQKFTLNTSGVMPTLTSAIVAAELPVGEVVHKIYYYLGYMMIGTSKGVRAAVVSDQDGSINYGPLIVETSQPCYDFAARDHYVWCATGVDGEPGVIRIDLSNEIETLRFAYANDIYQSGVTGRYTTACAFIDGTDQLAFTSQANIKGTRVTNKAKTSGVVTLTTQTAHGLSVGDIIWVQGVDTVSGSVFNSTTTTFTVVSVPTTTTFTYALAGTDVVSTVVSATTAHVTSPGAVYIESATNLISSGYLTTGNIRYGTLEPKNFKRLIGRGDFSKGSLSLLTVDIDGVEYDHITYDSQVPSLEVGTNQPSVAREYIAYKFLFTRDATTASLGPVFKGYQAKATIATPRQRLIQFPVYCFDTESDRNGVTTGYKGRAHERLLQLEAIEESGDVLLWQDLNTQELRQVQIEGISFKRTTPPDKFNGYGGIITIVVRTV